MFIRYFLTALLSITVSVLSVGTSFAQTGANATWRVQKYNINVSPQPEARSIAVKAIVKLVNVSGNPAATLTLRISPTADVTSVRINNAVADIAKSEEKISSSQSLQRIVSRFPSVPAGGIVTVAVEYKLNVKENSASASLSPTDAQFLPSSFWYPTPNSWYFPRGSDFAPLRLQIQPLAGLSSVSSGSSSAAGGATSQAIYDQTLNAQPFFLTDSWEASETFGVQVLRPKGMGPDGQARATELASVMSDAKSFMTSVLGKAPDVQMRIVAARRGAGFTSGGTVIVDEAVFRRPKIDSLTAMNIAEAVAKIWLGGAVSVNGDGFGAITEGLSRYLATQFIENKYDKDVADVERLRQRTAYAAVSKRDSPIMIASPVDDFYYSEVANKGAMVWRLLARRIGSSEFSNAIKANMQDGNLTLAELRAAFSSQKELVDYMFDQLTDMDLLAGVPQVNGNEAKVALRNTGGVDVTVDVVATTASGQKITAPTTIRATSFGEVTFKSTDRVVRVEIDAEKLYPQMDYSNDVAPRESTESDPLLAAKNYFDKQDYANTEKTARSLLRDLPRFDELRILLARSLLAQNNNTEAEKEFRAVLDEKQPAARSLAWANVGLGEIAAKSNQTAAAIKFADTAILIDAEFGASLAARNLRNRLGAAGQVDPGIKAFFADFDKAAAANRKADVDALIMPGEITRFASGVAGSTQQWQTAVRRVDQLDAETVLVEADMTVKLLNKNVENGMAVYRLSKVGNGWKLSGVDVFEVR